MTPQQSQQSAKPGIKAKVGNLLQQIKASAPVRLCTRAPRAVYAACGAFAATVLVLMGVSFSLGHVVVHQGYETIAFATPAASARLIRQTEVAQFGDRVSDALGVKNDVAHEFADWILEASERQGLSPELLASLVLTESSFRKQVRSHVGAIGPAQVRPDYWGDFCGHADELHDPEQNVYCGAQVLSHLLERCSGDKECALAAYNIGPYSQRAAAANRYLQKIDRYLSSFEEQSL